MVRMLENPMIMYEPAEGPDLRKYADAIDDLYSRLSRICLRMQDIDLPEFGRDRIFDQFDIAEIELLKLVQVIDDLL